MTAVIICSGTIEDYSYYYKYISEAELIICADGGAAHAQKMGVTPHILVGDFDSISDTVLDFYKSSGVEIIKFPAEKDMTDTEIALDLAIDRGFRTIILLGALGTRMDHSLANVFLLKRLLNRGIKGIIANEYNEMAVIKDRIELQREQGVKVTLLPLSEAVEGVTTKGLYYPLDNATLELGSSLGVSNEFAADTAEVTVKSGLLLVIKARD